MNQGNKTFFHDYLCREAFGGRGWARLGEMAISEYSLGRKNYGN